MPRAKNKIPRTIGVDYDTLTKKWRARITRNSVVYFLGQHDTKRQAIAARKDAEVRYSKGLPFKYTHRYSANQSPLDFDGDRYLFYRAIQDPVKTEDPLRNLRFAILIQSIKDHTRSRNRRLVEAATAWFSGELKSEPTFSFLEICEILELDPKRITAGLTCEESGQSVRRSIRKIGRRSAPKS